MLVMSELNRQCESYFTKKYPEICLFHEVEPMKMFYQNVHVGTVPQEGFIEFNLEEGDSNQITFGGPEDLWRFFGVMFFNVYRPLNEGTRTMRTHADIVATMCRKNSAICGLTMFAPIYTKQFYNFDSIRYGVPAPTDTTGWASMVVSVPYKYDVYL